MITLSFDNGPDPDVTPRVLAILAARDLRAQFYVLGKHAAAHPELIAQIRDAGHAIGNHSYTHAVPLGLDPRPDAVAQEIAATEAVLEPLVPGVRVFRPFGGGGALGPHLLSRAAVDYLCQHTYTLALWTSVPRDWIEPAAWAARALADCAAQAHAVVVLHDIPGACLDGLAGFLDAARDRGHAFTAELPASCTPIVRGVVMADLAGLHT